MTIRFHKISALAAMLATAAVLTLAPGQAAAVVTDPGDPGFGGGDPVGPPVGPPAGGPGGAPNLVPEPGSLWLVGISLAGLVVVSRIARRRAKSKADAR